MSQVQCPNCGGYKVSSKKISVTSTGERLRYNPLPGMKQFWIGLVFYIVAILYIAIAMGPPVMLVVGAIVGVPVFAYIYSYAKKIDDAVLAFVHTCNLCGYNWIRREGQPAPDITVRPDLIEQGALKLEEEKQQRDAAIAFQAREYQKRKNK